MSSNWQTLASRKRQAILDAIPKEWRLKSIPSAADQKDVTGPYIEQFLSPDEIEVTRFDADQILKKTTTGEWTAEKVTRAFCHRAALAHQLVSCLHEVFFDAAISDARALDAYFEAHKKLVGPLHGLPVSLKDQFHIKGVETTMGYTGWISTFQGQSSHPHYLKQESVLVKQLRSLGAVLYCKTAVPHTLMTGETVNNIIGYCWNPNNRHLSCGGSSGGEGALIALRGSVVGVGSDIGGSVRMPAAFNGVYSLKTCSGRIPYHDVANSMDGQISVSSTLGPLASSVSGLRVFTKAIIEAEPWLQDPMVHDIPWRDSTLFDVPTRKLTFGVLRTDGIVNPQPPLTRAINHLVSLLQAAGHEIIDWSPPSHQPINDATHKAYQYDGGCDVLKDFALSDEPMSGQLSLMPTSPLPEATATEIANNNVTLRNLRKEYMDYWNSTASKTQSGRVVDTIIAPVAFTPAVRFNGFKYYGYSTFVNGLDYASAVVPVTRVDKALDVKDDGYKALNDVDRECYDLYDAEVYHGTPVGVQLIGRRLQEEKMLAVADLVDGLLRKAAV